MTLNDPIATIEVKGGKLVVTLTDGQVLEEPTTLRETASTRELRDAGWDLVVRRRAWAGPVSNPPYPP